MGAPGSSELKRIEEVNKVAIDQIKVIKEGDAEAASLRQDLDSHMGSRYAAMRPLCLEYMKHRAQILGLAGAQCQAAQGRVNAEDLTVVKGPNGCLAPDASGASETEP